MLAHLSEASALPLTALLPLHTLSCMLLGAVLADAGDLGCRVQVYSRHCLVLWGTAQVGCRAKAALRLA